MRLSTSTAMAASPCCAGKPRARSLGPMVAFWAYLRANFLSHRVWDGYQAIVEACCDAWNRLMNTPERLASITRRAWAKAVTG